MLIYGVGPNHWITRSVKPEPLAKFDLLEHVSIWAETIGVKIPHERRTDRGAARQESRNLSLNPRRNENIDSKSHGRPPGTFVPMPGKLNQSLGFPKPLQLKNLKFWIVS